MTVNLHLNGFVDDTNATLNDWQPQDEIDLDLLLERLRHDAQLWNDLLFISGGKLELAKCSFHVLRFAFQPDGTPKPIFETPPPIQLTDSITQAPIEIQGLRADEPHRTLGHWKAPLEIPRSNCKLSSTRPAKSASGYPLAQSHGMAPSWDTMAYISLDSLMSYRSASSRIGI